MSIESAEFTTSARVGGLLSLPSLPIYEICVVRGGMHELCGL